MNINMRRLLSGIFFTVALLTNCFAQRNIYISTPGDVGNNYLINCDDASSETETTVFFYDSGGQYGNYSPNSSYTREMTSINGGSISVKFIQFSLASGTFLTIMDNVSQQILVSNATGSTLNGRTFTSNLGSLRFICCSDSLTDAGFKAKVWCGCMSQQFQTIITPSIDPTIDNTYDVCSGTEINFSASSEFYQNDDQYVMYEDSLTYDWGIIDTNNDTLWFYNAGRNFSFTFTENGSFFVFCNATDTRGYINNNINMLRVRVSIPPTWEDVSFYPDSVCSGDQITLIGDVHPETWYEPINYNLNTDTLYIVDGYDYCCRTSLYFYLFEEGAIVNSINDIEKIYLNIEHSYLGDLSIMLECPNGQNCLLHGYSSYHPTVAPGWELTTINNSNSKGGGNIHLGLAPDPMTSSDCYYTAGVGYDYNFTPTATQYMGSNTPYFTSITYTDPCGTTESSNVLNPGDYASYESMASLVGCPLNGLWTLYVCEHLQIDNGYIFGWGIDFSEDVYHDNLWSYSNSYPESSFSWRGEGLQTGMSGDSYATAIVHNNDTNNWREIPYTFSATDNFGCTYDTTIIVHVKPAMYEGCDSTPTMNETELTEEISIIPNPVHDIINIYSPETISEIEIVNTLGKVVKRVDVNAYNVACNVEDLPNGLYVVRIYANSHAEHSRSARVVRKFIKE